MAYLKWIFEESDKPIKMDEVTTCDIWDPDNTDWDKRGGFNFSNEENILRWISRGDTLCEVIIPEDAEMKNVVNQKTPDGIFVANKIILTNPIKVSDELTMELYKKSNMPLETYFETIAALAVRGCYNTALQIIKVYNQVLDVLNEIKSDILINLFIDKEPYIKTITGDKIINLTGQSGSGKSTYALNNFNTSDYIVIDTDDIFSEERFKEAKGLNKELGELFRSKYNPLSNCGDDFDLIYNEILDYCKNIKETIVIDCAQFHCIKDISLLKGKLIVIRTCIDNCYNRTIERFKRIKPSYTEEELNKYIEKKKSIYKWYKYSNEFIKNIDKI